ncbi:hypothetical protein Spith_1437 [Spirochaeta thermophila DSM 6578]|uniref:Uncharacterized protein n=1 Tax=Winmispira thermophila (strain ATCC 700085 / DSM 6578 / Z-1203) TaxID=869211 RepID=G0GA13_WINT7|nr:hypothetical protein [Spirochaeta thermophila]AEJ61701.1 hypothetical protein Spith_1437 [Spirochaeta thermophila DSM 6578]
MNKQSLKREVETLLDVLLVCALIALVGAVAAYGLWGLAVLSSPLLAWLTVGLTAFLVGFHLFRGLVVRIRSKGLRAYAKEVLVPFLKGLVRWILGGTGIIGGLLLMSAGSPLAGAAVAGAALLLVLFLRYLL